MRLEGTLDAFSLPDIFSLLSMTKKTGTLHLREGRDHGTVHLREGSVVGARSDVRRQELARRLVGAGLIEDEALADTVERLMEDSTIGLGRALADALNPEVVHQIATEQVTDAVFDMLRWPSGEFEFVHDETHPDDLDVNISVDEVVAEGQRRIEEWKRLAEAIPDPDALVWFVSNPEADPALSAEEWQLLQLVDGRRTVGDLVQLSGRGDYALVKTLSAMVDRGLLMVRTPADGDAISAVLRRQNLLAALEGMPLPADPDESTVTGPSAQAEPAVENESHHEAVDAPSAPRHADPQQSPAASEPLVPSQVIPERPEPFTPARQPDHPEPAYASASPTADSVESHVGSVDGATALKPDLAPNPDGSPQAVERDPSINKSLLLRLIAGVRGL